MERTFTLPATDGSNQTRPQQLLILQRRVWKRSRSQWRQGKGHRTEMGCQQTFHLPDAKSLSSFRPSSSNRTHTRLLEGFRSVLFAESLGTEAGLPCGQGNPSSRARGLRPRRWLSEWFCAFLSSPWVTAPGLGRAPAPPLHRYTPAGSTFGVRSGPDAKAAASPAPLS